MDTQLQELIEASSDDVDIKVYPRTAEVHIQAGGKQITYQLKPLRELYGAGLNRATLDPKDEAYMPLLQGIEAEILQCDRDKPLTDGTVLLELQTLAGNPEGSFGDDHDIARAVQTELRLVLSLNDYSRQDVRQALRRICKSIETHTREGGPRGYLNFIAQFV